MGTRAALLEVAARLAALATAAEEPPPLASVLGAELAAATSAAPAVVTNITYNFGGSAQPATPEFPAGPASPSPPPHSSSASASSPAASAPPPAAPSAAPEEPASEPETAPPPPPWGRGGRWYVVWTAPETPAVVGLWVGADVSTWDALESRLRGGSYARSGARLRRYASESEALEAWRSAGPRPRPTAAPLYHFGPAWDPVSYP